MTQSTMQQGQKSADTAYFNYLDKGVVEDWSTRHVVFSNPGTLDDAAREGRREEWEHIVTNPRYRMQWVRRYAASDGLTEESADILQAPSGVELPVGVFQKKWKEKKGFRNAPLKGDWSVQLGSSTASVAPDMYPAKYTFAPDAAPSCTADFVVFPVNAAGNSSQQANLIGVSNLYKTTCTGTVPNVSFAYFVGTGTIQTSPVLSENGTKVAFVESVTSGSIFHVLTIGTTGSNGTAFNSVAVPGTGNNAVDTKITMNGGASVTRSSPFVDYTNDIAYIGDDSGKLHKFTGVFNGTPTEVTTAPWPFTVASGVILTGPVHDGGTSGNIFVGGSNGNLYCITSAGAHCATSSTSVGTGTNPAILDAPIVDSTNERVFATANTNANAVLVQATTALATKTTAPMGAPGTDLYGGAFDNAYFTSVSTGHMYFCGNATGSAIPTLFRVTFNTSGTMSTSHDTNSFTLATVAGTNSDCTPLTEVLNGTTDYLFLGVKDNGFNTGTPNCAGNTCIMTFVITSSFPTGPTATLNTLGNAGVSGIIIDNVSNSAGASQIYFGDLQTSTGVQVSQSALQ